MWIFIIFCDVDSRFILLFFCNWLLSLVYIHLNYYRWWLWAVYSCLFLYFSSFVVEPIDFLIFFSLIVICGCGWFHSIFSFHCVCRYVIDVFFLFTSLRVILAKDGCCSLILSLPFFRYVCKFLDFVHFSAALTACRESVLASPSSAGRPCAWGPFYECLADNLRFLCYFLPKSSLYIKAMTVFRCSCL